MPSETAMTSTNRPRAWASVRAPSRMLWRGPAVRSVVTRGTLASSIVVTAATEPTHPRMTQACSPRLV